MEIKRQWAMPNSMTFSIKPIGDLIRKHISETQARFMTLGGSTFIDPFARNNDLADITNDLDPSTKAHFHIDALDWLKSFGDASVTGVLFDPPYSPRQVSECYKKLGKTVNTQTTQASFWSALKQEISRIVKCGGIVITCGWNSGGIGKNLGFSLVEILLVPHGGWHNDTIVTVERRQISGPMPEGGE